MNRCILIALLFFTRLVANQPPSFALTESMPSAFVAGTVNVITGNHYVFEEEITVQGAFPLRIPRIYISGCGDTTFSGWQLFPHLFAGISTEYRNEDSAFWKILVREPNGTPLEFETEAARPRKGRPLIFKLKADDSRKGLTNMGRGQISGRTNLKNIRIELAYDHKSFIAYTPDGSIRFYKKIKVDEWDGVPTDYLQRHVEKVYLLQWEQLPNQSKICYGYDKHHRVNVIRTTTLDTQKTFASATFHYHSDKLNKNRHFDITTSDGRTLYYRFDSKKGNFLLNHVNTPAFPQEVLTYHDTVKHLGMTWGFVLDKRTIAPDRYYSLDYYWHGKNIVGNKKINIDWEDPRWLRVKTLSKPVGEDNAPHATHTFFYDIVARETLVRDIDNILTKYRYSTNYRIEEIQYFGAGDQLHHSEKFVWGENGLLAANLLCHTFFDHQNIPVFSKRFFYDERGNVIEEHLYGNLSGTGSNPILFDKEGFPKTKNTEVYITKRNFSQDGFNLLLREEEQNGKITIHNYLPNTALPISTFTYDGNQIKIRHFYEYNQDSILIREVTDDGSTSDINNCNGVKTRYIKEYSLVPDGEPFQGMPQIITEKFWNGSSEQLLRRTVLKYTTGGLVEQEDIYDSNNEHRFSLVKKYDSAGRLKEETNAIGQVAIYNYDAAGNKIYEQDFSGKNVTRMDYDCSNRLIKVDETDHNTIFHSTKHRYDTKHNRISTLDHQGNETRFVPNSFGQIIEKYSPPIATSTGELAYPIERQEYDSYGRLATYTDPRKFTTKKSYNARHQVTQIEYPDGGVEKFVYNINGTLASHTNQVGATDSFTYDFLERLTSHTNALGYTTLFHYDAYNLLAVHDPEGNITSYQYDGIGRLIAEEKGGQKTEYFYDPLGRVHCTKKGEAYHLTAYDLLDRITEERDEDGHQNIYKLISYEYDSAGNLSQITQTINGQIAQESFVHDSLYRQIQHKDAHGNASTTTYNENFINSLGQKVLQTIETDPLGLQTITTYDVLGHVASQHNHLDSEEYFYDECGNLILHIKNNNQKTSWKYDPMNRVETLVEGGKKTTHFSYSHTGQLTSKHKPDGVIVSNSYDLLDRLTETSSTDQTIHYSIIYNKMGQQIGEKNGSNGTQITRSYDAHGNLLAEKFPNNLTISSTYDDQGRKTKLVLPNNTEVIYQYDPIFLRRIIRDQKHHDFNQYDLSGRLIHQTPMGSLGSMTYTYDLIGRKTSQESSFDHTVVTYDPVGNLLSQQTSTVTKTYAYDSLYQLIQEQNHQYRYDLNGNRISKNQEEFRYNNLNENISHQTFDPNGNPQLDGNTAYFYDALDRLISIRTTSHQIDFQYDFQGRLLSKTTNGMPTFYLYDEVKEIGSFDAKGSPHELRILNPTFPSERGATVLIEINNYSFIPTHDLFGNIVSLRDLQGTLIESYDYTAFGENLQSPLNPWLYASKRFHSDAELINFGKRFYNPKYGRWLTPDPAGFIDSYNLYAFVHNNPLTNFDLFGLYSSPLISCPPHYLDANEAAKLATPIIHAVGEMAIDTCNFLSNTGFCLSSPLIALQHDFVLKDIIADYQGVQDTYTYFHNEWDKAVQLSIPMHERTESYYHTKSITESAIGGYTLAKTAGQALLNNAIKLASRWTNSTTTTLRNSGISSNEKIENAVQSIENFLGGNGKIITNTDGDMIIIRGNKKIRFDIKDPHGDKPHFHLEKKNPSGKWVDASPQHRYYFKEE